MRFEDLLSDFSSDFLSHQQFLFNALIAAGLAYLLQLFYVRYGRSVSNRSQFSSNFMLLALATMLIIYIVKSSIALSLGLVGALSIVRFRAAIKEPEELVYLFLVIGIGLGMGANQVIITLLAFLLILSLLVIQAMINRRVPLRAPENMFLNISTSELDVDSINKVLADNFKTVELKRMDAFKGRLDLSYIIEAQEIDSVIQAKDKLIALSPDVSFSFVEQKNLAI